MSKTILKTVASGVLLFSFSNQAFAELEMDWELSGVAKNETALFTANGPVTGERTTITDTSEHDAGELLKFENSLNFFINGTFSEETMLHAQVNLVFESEGADGYKDHQEYTQNDYLRELYLDTVTGPVDWRVGKQQVVWGTADGIKLLDILNPTDFREFVQNTMEDSRIPVWMIKAEAALGEGGLQLVAAQHRQNMIPGLNEEGDEGQPFIMKGVDSLTGKVDGFYNIVPEMGDVSRAFWGTAAAAGVGPNGAIPCFVGQTGDCNDATLDTYNYVTVGDFSSMPNIINPRNLANPELGNPQGPVIFPEGTPLPDEMKGAQMLSGIAIDPDPYGVGGVTNLIDGGGNDWDSNNPDSVFEYMPNATFATFDTFVGAKTDYRRDYPDEFDPNLGLRYKGLIGESFNYSLNYLWHYDANPYVDLHWEGDDGEKLTPTTNAGFKTDRVTPTTTVTLDGYGGTKNKPVTLVFTERLNRIHSLGSSFDTAVETEAIGPVVLRGEVLYQIDTRTPVVDRTKLGYGDLVGGVQSTEADFVKYVLGADITILTNLMISGQFIQFVNLDYVDENGDNGTNWRYSANPAVMHLSNGLLKAEEFKEFYSLFLSKPYGEEQEGRLNNLIMYEEGGGLWNRLNTEYAFDDQWVGIAEWNHYFGDEDTMFGQFKNSSNIQMGIKYIYSP